MSLETFNKLWRYYLPFSYSGACLYVPRQEPEHSFTYPGNLTNQILAFSLQYDNYIYLLLQTLSSVCNYESLILHLYQLEFPRHKDEYAKYQCTQRTDS